MKRAFLAFSLLLSLLAPAFAQAPPPVPALPDAERRTVYTIAASKCNCAVNFALYGDASDYQNWVEVFINGVLAPYNDGVVGWTITSPSGTLSSIPRPISNAVLNFNNPQTGTIQIIGARRPRRTSQFQENKGVAARDLNQVLTDIIAQNREIWDKTNDFIGRGLFSQPGVDLGLLPLPSACANMVLGFDATGLNPICTAGGGGPGGGNITINGIICSVGGACTVPAALVAGVTPITSGQANTVLYEDAGGKFNFLSNINSAVLVTTGLGVPTLSTSLPGGLTIPGPVITGAPSGAGAIVSINGTACQLGGSCFVTGPLVIGTTLINGSVVNAIFYVGAGNLLADTNTLANATLVTSGGSVPSLSTTLPAAVQANITGTGTLTSGATGTGFTLALSTSTLTGAIPLANGGTNNTGLTPSAGGIVWTDATKMQVIAGTVTPGQCLLSANLAAPTWGSCSGAAAVSSVANSDSTLTVSPTTGAVIASLNLSHANTWAAAQTHNDATLKLAGATSGALTLHAAAIAGTDSITFPHVTDTVAVLGLAQSFSQPQTFVSGGIIMGGASTGVTTFVSANAGASNFTLTYPAITSTIMVTGANQTVTGNNNFTGSVQVNGNAMTFPGAPANLAALNLSQSFTTGQAVTPTAMGTQAAAGTMTLDFSASNYFTATFGAGNLTIANPTNIKAGECGWLTLTQDATGGRTVTSWGSDFKWPGGTAPTLSTAANAVDLVGFCAITTSIIAAQLSIANYH